MKSFFEHRKASFVMISCRVKRTGQCQKVAKTRAKNSYSKQCSSHRNQPNILEVIAEQERNEKTNEKTLSVKEVFYL